MSSLGCRFTPNGIVPGSASCTFKDAKAIKKENKMYLIAWEVNGIKNWEVVSGCDAMQERVSELVYELGGFEGGFDGDDVVVGEITEDIPEYGTPR